MEQLKIAICEDTASDRELLLRTVRSIEKSAEVTLYESGEEFLNAWKSGCFDVVFMDIYMGGITGVDVVQHIRKSDTHVIVVFTTTSPDHALEGYRLNVARYLEKPVEQSAVAEVLSLALERKSRKQGLPVVLKEKVFPLLTDELMFAEQKAHYVVFYYTNNRTETVKGKLDELTPQLADYPFFRCHKSYLVNLSFVIDADTELLLFRLREGKSVYIRRESLRPAMDAWESWLFSQTRKSGELG